MSLQDLKFLLCAVVQWSTHYTISTAACYGWMTDRRLMVYDSMLWMDDRSALDGV